MSNKVTRPSCTCQPYDAGRNCNAIIKQISLTLDSPSTVCLLTFSALPTRLNSGVLPGFFRRWYIFDMLLLPGLSSSSSFNCRTLPRSFCSDSGGIRVLKLVTCVFEGSLLVRGEGGGMSGGDCGKGGSVAKSGPTSPPKLDRSIPSRFIGLLFGSGESLSFRRSRSGLALIVSPAGLDLDCRGMAAVRGEVLAMSFCMSYPRS